jgi:hypothetical protein
MITPQDLKAAIAECEGIRNPDARTCIKLAAYYQLLDRKENAEPMPQYSYENRVTEIPYSNSEFSQLVEQIGMEKAFPVIDELMETLQIVQPRLYDAVMMKLS